MVEGARAAALKPFARENEAEFIRVYAQLVEHGPDTPAALRWEGPDAMRIRAQLKPGEAVLVQVAWDPAWRAYSRGRPVPIRKDALGHMLIEAPSGEQELRLVFETPLENYVGRVLSVVCGVMVLVLLVTGDRLRKVRAWCGTS